jgi:hypothetical protein
MYNVHILSLNWIKFFQNCQSQETEQEEQRRLLHNINNQIRASLLNISQQIHAQKEAKNRENMETHFTQINNADEEHINYEKVYWQNASNFFLNLYIQYMYLKRITMQRQVARNFEMLKFNFLFVYNLNYA